MQEPRRRDVFVGREDELGLLESRIEMTAEGSGGVVLVAGEAGIGKTRLAEEAVKSALAKGVYPLWGRCWEGAGAPVFWPWVQVIGSLTESMSVSGDAGSHRGAFVGRDAEQVLRAAGLSATLAGSDQDRFRFFEGLERFLTTCARARPLILVFDDLHYADLSSLLLIQFLATRMASHSILLLGTYRQQGHSHQNPLSKTLGSLSRQRGSEMIRLAGLASLEVRALIQAFSGSPPSDQVLTSLMEKTNGNPFFLTEVLAALGAADLKGLVQSEAFECIPQTIREVTRSQLCSLSTDCIRMLEAASVVGREFDVEVVAKAIGKSAGDLCVLLEEAIRAGYIEQRRFSHYRFRHALVREAIYECLATILRAQMHFMVAQALKEGGGEPQYSILTMLAHHLTMSIPYGSVTDAVTHVLRAGMEAKALFAYEEAITYFERALEIGGSDLEAGAHCDILLALGDAQMCAGFWRKSRDTFEKVATEARSAQKWNQLALAAIGFKGLVVGAAPVDSLAVTLLREALDKLGNYDDRLLVRVLVALANALYFANCDWEVEQLCERALSIAERLDDQVLKIVALDARIVNMFRPTHLDLRRQNALALVGLAVKSNDREMLFYGHFTLHACWLEIGDVLQSARELEWAARYAEQGRSSRSRWQISLARSSQALLRGQLGESWQLTKVANELGGRVDDAAAAHYFIVQRFQYERIRGNAGELLGQIDAGASRYPDIVAYRVAHAAIVGSLGAPTDARNILNPLAESEFTNIPCDSLFLWTLGVLTEAVVGCGDREWWERLYGLLLPFRNHNVVMSWGVAFDGSVEHYLGVLSTVLGSRDRGVEHFEAALTMNTKMGAVPLVARTQERYAALLAQRDSGDGDRTRARELLEQAVETMERVGMVGYLPRARQLREELEGHRPGWCSGDAGGGGAGKEAVGAGQAHQGDPRYLFRREGDYWSVAFDGVLVRLRHTRGLALLAVLLRHPETELHVFDLISAVDGMAGESAAEKGRGGLEFRVAFEGDAGPLADGRARAEYRRRLEELRAELVEAEGCNDFGRTEVLRQEIEQVVDELRRVYGRSGRLRRAHSASERSRVNVRNNVSYALSMLKKSNEGLWRHMKAAVRTGTFCSYQPERAIPWTF